MVPVLIRNDRFYDTPYDPILWFIDSGSACVWFAIFTATQITSSLAKKRTRFLRQNSGMKKQLIGQHQHPTMPKVFTGMRWKRACCCPCHWFKSRAIDHACEDLLTEHKPLTYLVMITARQGPNGIACYLWANANLVSISKYRLQY